MRRPAALGSAAWGWCAGQVSLKALAMPEGVRRYMVSLSQVSSVRALLLLMSCLEGGVVERGLLQPFLGDAAREAGRRRRPGGRCRLGGRGLDARHLLAGPGGGCGGWRGGGLGALLPGGGGRSGVDGGRRGRSGRLALCSCKHSTRGGVDVCPGREEEEARAGWAANARAPRRASPSAEPSLSALRLAASCFLLLLLLAVLCGTLAGAGGWRALLRLAVVVWSPHPVTMLLFLAVDGTGSGCCCGLLLLAAAAASPPGCTGAASLTSCCCAAGCWTLRTICASGARSARQNTRARHCSLCWRCFRPRVLAPQAHLACRPWHRTSARRPSRRGWLGRNRRTEARRTRTCRPPSLPVVQVDLSRFCAFGSTVLRERIGSAGQVSASAPGPLCGQWVCGLSCSAVGGVGVMVGAVGHGPSLVPQEASREEEQTSISRDRRSQ